MLRPVAGRNVVTCGRRPPEDDSIAATPRPDIPSAPPSVERPAVLAAAWPSPAAEGAHIVCSLNAVLHIVPFWVQTRA